MHSYRSGESILLKKKNLLQWSLVNCLNRAEGSKNNEAKVFHKESLETYKSIFGEKNPILIQPYINLAMVLYKKYA